MSIWPTASLGEVLRPISRAERVDPAREYKILGVRWYAQGFFIKDRALGQSISAPRVFRVESGDFVYNRLFAWKGSFALASDEFDGCYVSNEFPCFEITKDRLEPAFLHWWFSREMVWFKALGLSTGATPTSRNRLKEGSLLSLEIPLPPLPEQRRVVARIEEVARLVSEARALRSAADLEATALVAAGRRRLVGDRPGKDWVRLGSFVDAIENGRSPQCENRPAAADEWGILKVGAVSFGSFEEGENKALPVGHVVNERHELRVGDFLMSRANTSNLVGACALVKECRPKLLLSDKIFRFRFRSSSQPISAWLDEVLKAPALRVQIERSATGTSPTMKNISKEKVLDLLVPDHTAETMSSIVEELRAIRTGVGRTEALSAESSTALDALLPAVLDRAFRREL